MVALVKTAEGGIARGIVRTVIEAVVVERQLGMGPVTTRFGVGVLKLAPYLDGMVALDHREVLLPIVGSVWTSDNGVTLDAADHRVIRISEISQIIKAGHAKILLVLRPRTQRILVETQSVGIDVVVKANALREPLVAKAAFQNLGGGDGPGVIETRELGAGRRDGIPHVRAGGQRSDRLGHTRCGRLALQAIAEQIFRRQTVIWAEDVI